MVPKNNKDLLHFACEKMDAVATGKIDSQQGNAIAGILRQAQNALRFKHQRAQMEMKLHKFNNQNGTNIRLREIQR